MVLVSFEFFPVVKRRLTIATKRFPLQWMYLFLMICKSGLICSFWDTQFTFKLFNFSMNNSGFYSLQYFHFHAVSQILYKDLKKRLLSINNLTFFKYYTDINLFIIFFLHFFMLKHAIGSLTQFSISTLTWIFNSN